MSGVQSVLEASGGAFLLGMFAFIGSSVIVLSTDGGAIAKPTKNTYALSAVVGFILYGMARRGGG